MDISTPKIADNLIDRFVEVVTPFEDYSYRWKLNFGEKVTRNERSDLCNIEPRQSSLLPLHSIRQRHTERPTKCLHNSERQHGQI